MTGRTSSKTKTLLGLLAAAICILMAVTFLKQDRYLYVAVVAIDRLGIILWAALILGAALSLGSALLRWLGLSPAGPGSRALFGVGLGLGALSVATLLLGVLGLVQKPLLLAMLAAAWLVGLREMRLLLRAIPRACSRARRASWFRLALWGILVFFALMNASRAFEPPWEYDSLEYHVAAPAAYDRASRVFFMRDNVYANFPQNMEMLYFLSMRLTGSPDRGALVGQMLGAAMGLLAALALRIFLGRLAGREAGDIAALILYTWPGITVYSGVPLVELALIFYGVLALWGLVWSFCRKRTRPGARGWLLLSAITTGLAIGVKYTAALLIFVPVAGWLVILSMLLGAGWKTGLKRVALYGVVALLAFSPWLVRNYVNTRNPVYPLLYGTFGSTNWDAQKDARWTHAHSPRDRSFASFREQAREAVFFDERKASLLLFVFIPLVLVCPKRTRGVAAFLAVHALVLFLLFFVFTQHNVRFLEAGVPVVAALSALGLSAVLGGRYGGILRVVLLALLLLGPSRWVCYMNARHSLGSALGAPLTVDHYFAGDPYDFKAEYEAMKHINDEQNLLPGSKVVFLGEARTFYCRRDHIASTVFDNQWLAEIVGASKTPDDIREAFVAAGITHLYVDSGELRRLQKSYRYPFNGAMIEGMLDQFDWPLFGEFVARHMTHIRTFRGPSAAAFPWAHWREISQDKALPHEFIALYAVQ